LRSQNCEKRQLASSHLSAWNNSSPTGRIGMKFCIWVFFRKSVEKIKVLLKSDKNNGCLTWRPVCFIIFCSVLLTMKNVSSVYRVWTNSLKRSGYLAEEVGFPDTSLYAVISAKPATLLYRSPVTLGHLCTERANSWSLLSNLATCLSWILATVSHLVFCCMFVLNLPVLAKPKCCVVFVSYCTWAEIVIHEQIYLLPVHTPFSTSTGIFYWQLTQYFTSGHYYWLGYVQYLLSNSTNCHCSLNWRLAVHRSVFIFQVGFLSWPPG
jgi:hypothetical protein